MRRSIFRLLQNTRLPAIEQGRDAEETVRLAINASDDGPCQVLTLPELSLGVWKVEGFVAGKPCYMTVRSGFTRAIWLV